jgi:hypothetical protein
MDQGFEESVAKRMLGHQADSTQRLYDLKWKEFEEYAEIKEFDPFHPTIPLIASFLESKFEENQGHRSLAGYRSAISATLKHHTDLEVGSNSQLSALIKGFKKAKPSVRKYQPDWDLNFILWSLGHKPFEPLNDPTKVSLKFLTWKTVFLLLLASGARRCELGAIGLRGVQFAESGEFVILSPSPEFIVKNQSAMGRALEPFKVPALSQIDPEDLRLCPVRCLREYLRRTKSVRNGRRNLFISHWRTDKKEIHKNTLSSWVKGLLLFCYQNPSKEALELSGTGSHEIRKLAASIVFRGTTSMEDILKVGFWKNQSTFTSFYLKDLSVLNGEEMRSIGPIVAGQKIVINSRIA